MINNLELVVYEREEIVVAKKYQILLTLSFQIIVYYIKNNKQSCINKNTRNINNNNLIGN